MIDHNAEKGAPLAEISLAEARALLDASLAESRRFSRPLPREYKISPGLVDRRVLRADLRPSTRRAPSSPPTSRPNTSSPPTSPRCSYRDYTLAIELLAERPPIARRSLDAEAADALRVELKHAPRREEAVEIASAHVPQGGEDARLLATGAEVAVQTSGKRVRSEVRERYTLRPAGGRLAHRADRAPELARTQPASGSRSMTQQNRA